ncbi:MAG: enoyl-CoA hydratase/isomerase family protein [Burkholderiaceae bacterium]|jgi:isohexenylglutaconyl-CoA hydratase|nr:enoyl-CoA hydratase/isomerase family protein [Burkholderiaceae bacterium]
MATSSSASLVHARALSGVHLIVLDAPATRNALSPDMVAALDTAVAAAAADPAARMIVLRGAGGFFSAGGNVGSFAQRLSDTETGGDDTVATKNRAFGRFLERLAALDLPLIAAVEGAAIGGGLGLAAVADFVLATADTKFSLTETTLGILPAQIAPFLIDRLGVMRVRQLSLSARRFDAREAHALGIVDTVCADVPALEQALADLIARIARCAPRANRRFKALLGHDWSTGRSAWLDQAARTFAACMRDEGPEGIAAFREKRAPTWVTDAALPDATALAAAFASFSAARP